jgi:Zn-dependent peptidase ImmA (M78 family)
LEHPTRTVERVGGWNFFTCDAEEEEEANWLAGCLLLPRPLLLREARRGATPPELAERYEVSEKMASFRLNASGVMLQVRRARA